MPAWLVLLVSLGYLLLLVAVAAWGDRRAAQARSLVANPWTYALSMAVYCTAWTYFGSVGRAASGGWWFLPIYLGPTLMWVLGWGVLRKVLRIAKTYRITSIADFIASRYGKSQGLAALVTLIALLGIVPYIALQLKAISGAFALLTQTDAAGAGPAWTLDGTLILALALAGFTMVFGTRHLDNTERHEGLVLAIAFESLIKLLAFTAVGALVVWGLFDGWADLARQVQTRWPHPLGWTLAGQANGHAWTQWGALTLLSGLAIVLLPRQFQVLVVENVAELHLRRAAWVFPLYLLAINVFVVPIALGGLLYFGATGAPNADGFVISLPLASGHAGLALLAFVGGLSAATGMVIVETIAVSTMVCNDLVMPLLLRTHAFGASANHDLTRVLLGIRRAAIVVVLMLGYAYFHLAGEAYALVSIGLISFAAVAQFAPAFFGGLYWRGATRAGAWAGLSSGFALWAYTLMLPSLAKSGWLDDGFMQHGLLGLAALKPEALLGLSGLDNLTHSLLWSLLANVAAFVAVSLWRAPSGAEASQALLFVDVFARSTRPVFWRGQAHLADLIRLSERYLGADRSRSLFDSYARKLGLRSAAFLSADPQLVQFVETQLAGAVGSASARVLIASSVQEDALSPEDVLRILDEASALRAYSRELEDKSDSLERASAELRAANEQLKSLDRLKDDFMSSVTHELRTPLTSIRAIAEILRDDPRCELEQRRHFIDIVVHETERLTRLVNQVLDMAKIESGHGEWRPAEIDLLDLVHSSLQTTAELFRERGIALHTDLPETPVRLWADPDRLTQVMLNLLSNAAKFTPQPGGRVDVSLRAEDDGVTVQVRDNGPGVPPEQQALIFEKFRQGGDDAHRPQGTGLGLPISRRIIEHFGGRLWLQSQGTAGAAFCFYLPRSHNEETPHEPQHPGGR